jgi:hypothetical protein
MSSNSPLVLPHKLVGWCHVLGPGPLPDRFLGGQRFRRGSRLNSHLSLLLFESFCRHKEVFAVHLFQVFRKIPLHQACRAPPCLVGQPVLALALPEGHLSVQSMELMEVFRTIRQEGMRLFTRACLVRYFSHSCYTLDSVHLFKSYGFLIP